MKTEYIVPTKRGLHLEDLVNEWITLRTLKEARHHIVKFGGLQPDNPSQELIMYQITLTKINPHPSFRPHRKAGHQFCELYLKSWEEVVKLPSSEAQYDCKLLGEMREILESHGFNEKHFTAISETTAALAYLVWYKIYQLVAQGEDDEIFQWSKFWA